VLTTVVVDDEPLARARLARMLAEFPDVVVLGEAANAFDAETLLAVRTPHVVFLDIDMPSKSGLELAASLATPVIFTTAHRKFAPEAFEVGAEDYLLKPIAKDRLALAIVRLKRRLGIADAAQPSPDGDPPWRLRVNENGKVSVFNTGALAVEGQPKSVMAIAEFPTLADAQRFYNSPEYSEAKKLRIAATEGSVVITEEFVLPAK